MGRGLHALEIATRLEAAIGLLEESTPVSDACSQEADVDVVERLRGECPFEVTVVNLAASVSTHTMPRMHSDGGAGQPRYNSQIEVGRCPAGLNGRHIRSDHLGLGELVREVSVKSSE